jgi:hypothetical protein
LIIKPIKQQSKPPTNHIPDVGKMVLTGFGAEKMAYQALSKHLFIVLLASGKRATNTRFSNKRSYLMSKK